MTAPGIHQVTAGAVPRDAVTNHVIEWQRVIRAMGLRSEIFTEADHIHPNLMEVVRPHVEWDDRTEDGDIAIIHYSIGSEAFDHILATNAPAVLAYHNITPPELLWEDAPGVALECAAGRRALHGLVGRFDRVAANSSFSADELRGAGFDDVYVTGVVRPELSRGTRTRATGEPQRLLFVGRGAPNKAQHDLILATTACRELGLDVELRLVGTWEGMETYEERCRALVVRLGMEDFVVFAGSVSDEQLAGEYANADAFVCLSDHEGFCVPVIEALAADLPVVALARGAVAETVGRAGIVITDKQPSIVAEAIAMALNDPQAQERMAAARPEQLASLSSAAVRMRLANFTAAIAS